MRKVLPLIAVISILFLLALINSPNKSSARHAAPTAMPAPKAIDACAMSHVFIKQQLKSPSTADFAVCDEPDTVVAHTGNQWTVRSYVDAQNSFGAQLRNDYAVEMLYLPSTDKWRLVNVAMQGP